MNVVYLIGLILAIAFTIFGIIVGIQVNIGNPDLPMFDVTFETLNLVNFFDLSSILIVIGGTLAVVIACYPKLAKSFPKHIKIMLRAQAFDHR